MEKIEFIPVDQLTFSQAQTELESILRAMQGDGCSIDSLTTYTKRAAELLQECRKRLIATDKELKTILESLDA